jgi:hypothetical protein
MLNPEAIEARIARERLQALLLLTRSGAVTWRKVAENGLEGSIGGQVIRVLLDDNNKISKIRFPANELFQALTVYKNAIIEEEYIKQKLMDELAEQFIAQSEAKLKIGKTEAHNENQTSHQIKIIFEITLFIFLLPHLMLGFGYFWLSLSNRPYAFLKFFLPFYR